MRPFARSAWLTAATLLAGSQMAPAARASPVWRCRAALDRARPRVPPVAAPCARTACVPSARLLLAAASSDQVPGPATVAPAGSAPPDAGAPADSGAASDKAPQAPAGREDAGGSLAPSGEAGPSGGAGPSPAAPEASAASPAAPREPARRRAAAAVPIGHFRVYEHPPCAGDPCQATVSDLDGGRSFGATVTLGPMHLARQLEELAGSGQIDLLLSGELRRGPAGPTLRALHLEGVTPHTSDPPAIPRAGHARPAPGAGRDHAPALPPRGLLRA